MTPNEVKADYRAFLAEAGDTDVVIRRYTGSGADRPFTDTPSLLARVVGYDPKELVGPIQQGDRKVIVFADDLVDAGFELPVRRGDKVVVRGEELNIEAADDSTRRVAGVLIAIEIRARGH
ncbi:hypothetical protein [Mesorhizobium sp. B2-4-6]|uniref:hypothetical protein n=1 Tax=Mesorhizobium sp. B2-4-6 TaxID=2589943 RepID=UPI00112C77AE|nr:hypothetical protein [Mesorhizobium sp. B2-4-6]TPL40692.1 hypothetical protein FJ957_26030 [Mesorhizobium sp. B2-4-6]